MKSFITSLLHKYYYHDPIKEDEMSRLYSIYGRDAKCVKHVGEKPEVTMPLG
jgi:hypothetical protein